MTASSPRVSVIIPIYNVEKYLEECLDSVLAQTMSDIEVICVNDGSTDSSPQIIKRYAENDPRIIVIDKPNGGYGHSVNRGLERARGEWLSIVEPDDIVSTRMYAELLALSKTSDGHDADIVKGSYWLYFHFDDRKPYVQRPNLMNHMPQGFCEIDINEDPEVMKHHPSIWSAIYRREFIEENGIRMIEPKGAGWADNPWFFETMLAAKHIVWTPAPYYNYRQTNPEASSKLNDYHLPFDRLRDIRAIYERQGIDNPLLLAALYQRSFDYICTTVLDEFKFPENDPELKGLIREVFETFDEELLLEKKTTIPNYRKSYYKDFMGLFLEKMKKTPEHDNPRLSYIMPMYDDRWGLWETIHSLRGQVFENYEVILVDCNSPDRCLEISEAVSQIDGRFRVLKGFDSVIEGFNAGLREARGEYVHFIRTGIGLEDRRVMRNVFRGIDSLGEAADIIFFKEKFATSRLMPREAEFEAVKLNVQNIESDVVLTTRPTVFTRMFRTQFLLDNGLQFEDERDPDGWGLNVKAICAAKDVIFAEARDVRTVTRELIKQASLHTEAEFIEDTMGLYDAIAQAAEDVGTETARRVARCCILHSMSIDLPKIGRYRSGEKYFDALSDAFFNKYGIYSSPWSDYANFLDFAILEEAFSLDYEDYAKEHLTNQQRAVVDITRHRDDLVRHIKRIEKSGSYIFGTGAATVAKAIIPKKVTRTVVDASIDYTAKREAKKG